jgi:hypothetical protein
VFAVDPSTPSFTIQYSLGAPNANCQFPTITGGSSGTKKIVIDASPVLGQAPATLDVTITVVYGANQVELTYTISPVAWAADPGAYVITQAQLDVVASAVVSDLNLLKTGFDSDTAISFQGPATLNATPSAGTATVSKKTPVANSLQFVMKQVLARPAAAAKK